MGKTALKEFQASPESRRSIEPTLIARRGAGPRGARGQIKAEDLRPQEQGLDSLAPAQGPVMAPVGGIGTFGIVGLGAAGVIPGSFSEIFESSGAALWLPSRSRFSLVSASRARGPIPLGGKKKQESNSATGDQSSAQGLTIDTPTSSKSATLRVTRMRSWTLAVAAISPSASPRDRSAAIRPHSMAT
jgi:hypothetical protein